MSKQFNRKKICEMTKLEWKKQEKHIYLPKSTPCVIEIPEFKYFQISGQGNPNSPEFAQCIKVLYNLSYALKMLPKKGISPSGFFDYAVYPLEGIWDISEEAKVLNSTTLDKNSLVYNLMIRQPDFVSMELAEEIKQTVVNKTKNQKVNQVYFGLIKEGKCVQMLHTGSYDNESQSFKLLENFCHENSLTRISKQHREIYLSDFRKVPEHKLRTVLRYQVK